MVRAVVLALGAGVCVVWRSHTHSRYREWVWLRQTRVCVGVPTVTKGLPSSGLSFYRFPVASDRRSEKENWQHERSWVCSAHFVSGKKSEDPLSPDY